MRHVNSQLQHGGSNFLTRVQTLGPLHWECRVLATRSPGKSLMSFHQSEKKKPPRRLDFTSQIYILYPISKPVSGRGYKSPVIGFGYSGFMVPPPFSSRRTQLGFCYPGWKLDWEAAPLAHHPFQARLLCLGSESVPASWRTLFC